MHFTPTEKELLDALRLEMRDRLHRPIRLLTLAEEGHEARALYLWRDEWRNYWRLVTVTLSVAPRLPGRRPLPRQRKFWVAAPGHPSGRQDHNLASLSDEVVFVGIDTFERVQRLRRPE